MEVAQVGEVDEGMRIRFISVEPQSRCMDRPLGGDARERPYGCCFAFRIRRGTDQIGWLEPGSKTSPWTLEVEVRIGVESESEQRMVDAVPVIVQGDSWTSVSEHARVAFSGPREAIRDLSVEDLYILLPAPSDLPMAVNSVNLRRGAGADYPFRVLHPPGIEVLSVEPSSFEWCDASEVFWNRRHSRTLGFRYPECRENPRACSCASRALWYGGTHCSRLAREWGGDFSGTLDGIGGRRC